MPIIGFFLLAFGITVIAMPEIVAYIIGVILVLIGANILLFSYTLRKGSKTGDKSRAFQFGEYEIIRNRK